ncbi:hypothetical protein HYH02_007343 [Chlamydomonas schloesseri]|uniref:Uncharacterized protein n=1 Tax=Chlamydomonas schloesseri TaxID=2026947 RepID=A0A835WIJ4_9CHLO|nr:hypothetical protein HYH02_007343 [Chlamydomonas schloesseri]|eukprot:KAG2447889.1 hypothetical protein HYH02_007343 [Chlamydomonas schloesseri]
MAWDLHKFIFDLKNLSDSEKELCFAKLDKEGFSDPTKCQVFFALSEAHLASVGIEKLGTRLALQLAIAGGPPPLLPARTATGGAAASLGMGSSSAAAVVDPRAGSAPGAGAVAGRGSGCTGAGNLSEDVFPSSVFCVTFTLYNGGHLVTTLTSHAQALGLRGKVRTISPSRSDFTLMASAATENHEQSLQTLRRFLAYMGTLVRLRKPAAEAGAAEAGAAEAGAAEAGAAEAGAAEARAGTSTADEAVTYVEFTSDLKAPYTSDQTLLDLYHGGQLSVSGRPATWLAAEREAQVAGQQEQSRKSSLGKSGESSVQE